MVPSSQIGRRRVLYFDSQIVRYRENEVFGPVMVLRRLQRLLRDSHAPGQLES